jgi:Predicted xylanase/chitin deacetylase
MDALLERRPKILKPIDMKKRLTYLFAFCFACLQVSALDNTNTHDAGAISIILKLDDMQHRNGAIPDSWQRVYDFAEERGIPISVGIICNSLEGNKPEYFEGLKAWASTDFVELWNHGYDHKQWTEGETRLREFNGTSYDFQLEHLKRSQELGLEKIGVTFVSFGSPFNSTDASTEQILSDLTDLKVWIYGPGYKRAGKSVLKRNYKINLEPKTGQLDFEQFKTAYMSNDRGELLVLQGHPMLWDDMEFEVFKQIIDFLESQNVRFALPRDFIPAS